MPGTRSSPIEALLISASISLKPGITKLVILQQEAPGVWGIGSALDKIGWNDNYKSKKSAGPFFSNAGQADLREFFLKLSLLPKLAQRQNADPVVCYFGTQVDE